MNDQYDKFGAWITADWSGAIKPSTDMKKQGEAMKILVAEGWITNARASRELTGTKFRRNIKKIKDENKIKAEAMRPILEIKKEFSISDSESNNEDDLEIIDPDDLEKE